MNKMRNQALLLLAMLALAIFTTSCESEDEPEASVEVGETVKDFVKVTQYEDSKTFHTDVDELVTYALAQHAFRWGYIYFASKGFEDCEPFATTPDDWANDPFCNGFAEALYEMINHFMENETKYSESIQRLENSGVLTKANETRDVVSDITEFFLGCKNTQVMGRKSVVSVIRQLGWSTNAAKMKQLFDDLPSNLRQDYSSYTKFWEDFSAGDLDARANQVFVNLYNYADMDFGEKCREIGTTPGGNITVAGADLIEKGLSVAIDVCPISGEIGYGKDIFGACEAVNELVKKGDVKGFLKNAAGNLINYGRDGQKLANKLRGIDKIYWADADDLWNAFGKDLMNIYTNDILFGQEFENAFDRGEGERFVPQLVRTKDANGQEITLVIMTDEASGQKIIGCVLDKDGNIITNPRIPGQKTITVLDRFTGKRLTKKVKVPADGDVDVEVDLKHYERELEEIPKNGDLRLQKNPLTDEGYGGSYKILIDTNYLYYTCEKDTSSWISARVGTDINFLYVTVAKNDTGKERTGHVTVAATDSKGKVLKTTVLTVKQTLPPVYEEWVDASPSSLKFDAKGGKKEVEITHSNALNYTLPVIGEELSSWCDLSWKETETGWNIVVEVDPNDTGKERSGTFTVYAANSQENVERAVKEGVFNKKVVQAVTVTVNQAADQSGGPSVSPTVLTVPSIGGALPVKVTFGDYTNSNWVLSNDAAKWITAGWNVDYLSPKRHTNQWYVIISPNDTKSARTDTLKIYFTKKENPTEKDRLYTPVVVKQEAGPYKLQDLSKLFVGTWYNPNEGPDNLGGYLYYRFTFNSNGSYTMETKYNKSKGADAGKWAVSQEGTYTVTSYKALTTCLRVNIQLTYKDSKGNKHTDNEICEMYPHFMRMVATYMERQE